MPNLVLLNHYPLSQSQAVDSGGNHITAEPTASTGLGAAHYFIENGRHRPKSPSLLLPMTWHNVHAAREAIVRDLNAGMPMDEHARKLADAAFHSGPEEFEDHVLQHYADHGLSPIMQCLEQGAGIQVGDYDPTTEHYTLSVSRPLDVDVVHSPAEIAHIQGTLKARARVLRDKVQAEHGLVVSRHPLITLAKQIEAAASKLKRRPTPGLEIHQALNNGSLLQHAGFDGFTHIGMDGRRVWGLLNPKQAASVHDGSHYSPTTAPIINKAITGTVGMHPRPFYEGDVAPRWSYLPDHNTFMVNMPMRTMMAMHAPAETFAHFASGAYHGTVIPHAHMQPTIESFRKNHEFLKLQHQKTMETWGEEGLRQRGIDPQIHARDLQTMSDFIGALDRHYDPRRGMSMVMMPYKTPPGHTLHQDAGDMWGVRVHEGIHQRQAEVAGDAGAPNIAIAHLDPAKSKDFFQNSPYAAHVRVAAHALKSLGYPANFQVIAAEVGAFLGAGQHRKLGMDEAAAKEALKGYVQAVVDQHGKDGAHHILSESHRIARDAVEEMTGHRPPLRSMPRANVELPSTALSRKAVADDVQHIGPIPTHDVIDASERQYHKLVEAYHSGGTKALEQAIAEAFGGEG